jgi:hypothetical protein
MGSVRPDREEHRTFEQEFFRVGRTTEAIEREVPETNPRKALYTELTRQIEPIMKGYDESGESARSFLRVATFSLAFNLDWYAVG